MMTRMEIINIKDKFQKFADHWNPRIVAELNGQQVKLARLKGTFIWHSHEHEDELFYILQGELKMEFRDKLEIIKAGEMIVVPKGVEHRPIADEEVLIMLFEPAQIKHTGKIKDKRTVENCEWI